MERSLHLPDLPCIKSHPITRLPYSSATLFESVDTTSEWTFSNVEVATETFYETPTQNLKNALACPFCMQSLCPYLCSSCMNTRLDWQKWKGAKRLIRAFRTRVYAELYQIQCQSQCQIEPTLKQNSRQNSCTQIENSNPVETSRAWLRKRIIDLRSQHQQRIRNLEVFRHEVMALPTKSNSKVALIKKEAIRQELKLKRQRRKFCLKLMSLFPFKQFTCNGEKTWTLRQKECMQFRETGDPDDLAELETALQNLAQILCGLSLYLDVSLPNPIIVGPLFNPKMLNNNGSADRMNINQNKPSTRESLENSLKASSNSLKCGSASDIITARELSIESLDELDAVKLSDIINFDERDKWSMSKVSTAAQSFKSFIFSKIGESVSARMPLSAQSYVFYLTESRVPMLARKMRGLSPFDAAKSCPVCDRSNVSNKMEILNDQFAPSSRKYEIEGITPKIFSGATRCMFSLSILDGTCETHFNEAIRLINMNLLHFCKRQACNLDVGMMDQSLCILNELLTSPELGCVVPKNPKSDYLWNRRIQKNSATSQQNAEWLLLELGDGCGWNETNTLES